MPINTSHILIVLLVSIIGACKANENLNQVTKIKSESEVYLKGFNIVIVQNNVEVNFQLGFSVMYRPEDPKLKLLPTNIEHVKYNVASWLAIDESKSDISKLAQDVSDIGDGFDPSILQGKTESRTQNYFNSASRFDVKPVQISQEDTLLFVQYPSNALFSLTATVDLAASPYPLVSFHLTTKQQGFYSVGFNGAPELSVEEADEIWQPLIWQEKRFPDNSYLTLAYRSPLPSAIVRNDYTNVAVLVHPDEFPFDPLPLATNSRFGVLVRNQDGLAQPMLFAPVMGGIESEMEPNQQFDFSFYLVNEQTKGITYAYENMARKAYGFSDYRKNDIASLNTVLENIVDYSLSEYGWFVDDLKGSAYSTDVPGAVKNVTSLNALELAIVMDSKQMFDERAYPTLEYMLSREKFLFSLDPEQKIQHPSRKLNGPVAPISELSSLFNITGKVNPVYIELAKQEFEGSRERNLDLKEPGSTWFNALWLYKATGDKVYLDLATSGADEYIKERVDIPAENYPPSSFFWTRFTPRFIELLELYEVTKQPQYILAAQDAARRFTQFTWMAPRIPKQEVLVNKGGKAPKYWYLASKGHTQMYDKEQFAPPARLSEIGLTPESSGTSSGHRAIFMANYAPWLLRIGYYTNDSFLKDVAKSAIIGRYRNFPGYHINTARTTIYERADYPLHPHKELSVNSFHYNHILPMASMVIDYLVSDMYVRSDGNVNFPSEFIEGYAYLQNKFYGHATGTFYENKDVQLWMPKGLLDINNVELNYISGYQGDTLYIAFANQSKMPVQSSFSINSELVSMNEKVNITTWHDNTLIDSRVKVGKSLNVNVSANGLTVLKIQGVNPQVQFSKQLLATTTVLSNDHLQFEAGNAQAMLLKLGDLGARAYIYLQDDDSEIESFSVSYTDKAGKLHKVIDSGFPFELTIELAEQENSFDFDLSVTDKAGHESVTSNLTLGIK